MPVDAAALTWIAHSSVTVVLLVMSLAYSNSRAAGDGDHRILHQSRLKRMESKATLVATEIRELAGQR